MTDFLEHHTGSPICVVAFASSGAKRDGQPCFEWKRTLDHLGVSYILMRDSADRWYQDGVKGIGDQIAVARYINDRTGLLYPRTFCLGLSSGAYAAVLFGALADVGRVIAISPVTVLGDNAAADFCPELSHRVQSAHSLDLRNRLRMPLGEWACPAFRAFVSDGDGAELDARMCELIGITPTLIPGQTHAGLARHMLDIGLVQKLIMGEA